MTANDKGQLDEALKKRARNQIVEALRDEALRTLLQRMEASGISLDTLVEKVKSREADPYTLVQEVLSQELRQ